MRRGGKAPGANRIKRLASPNPVHRDASAQGGGPSPAHAPDSPRRASGSFNSVIPFFDAHCAAGPWGRPAQPGRGARNGYLQCAGPHYNARLLRVDPTPLPSSRGPGHSPLKASTPVRIRLGAPIKSLRNQKVTIRKVTILEGCGPSVPSGATAGRKGKRHKQLHAFLA